MRLVLDFIWCNFLLLEWLLLYKLALRACKVKILYVSLSYVPFIISIRSNNFPKHISSSYLWMLLKISHIIQVYISLINQVILDDAWLKVSSCPPSRCMNNPARVMTHKHCIQMILRVVSFGKRRILLALNIFL